MSTISIEQTRAFVKQSYIYNPKAQLANNRKTKMCSEILKGNRCSFGVNCDFAHSESELRKKVCVFNSQGVCTIENCGYDHTNTSIPKVWKPITKFVPTNIQTQIIEEIDPELSQIESSTKKEICKRLYALFQRKINNLIPFANSIMTHFFKTFTEDQLCVMENNFYEFETKVKETYNIDNKSTARKLTDSPILEKTSVKSWVDITDEIEFDEILPTITDELNRYSFTPSLELNKSDIVLDHSLEPFNVHGDYQLYHINQVDINSPESVKNVRGIICKDDKVVCKAFSFTNEFTLDSEYFNIYVPNNFDYTSSVVLDTYEGTVVRYWYDDDTWHLSTYRKIEAGQSKWNNSSKTYLDYFIECLGRLGIRPVELYSKLDKNKVYVFQITNDNQNRMVVGGLTKEIYSLGSFDRTQKFKYSFDAPETGIPTPTKHNIQNKASLVNLVQSIDETKQVIGISLITAEGKIIKIINNTYEKKRDIRGEASNVYIRYLEVRSEPSKKQELINLFPTNQTQFNDVEMDVKDFISKYIYKLYKNRFYMFRSDKLVDNIYHKYNFVEVIHNSHLKFLHDIHDFLQTNSQTKNCPKCKLQLHHIWSYVDNMDKKSLYFMLKHYSKDKNIKVNY